ncbi:FAD-dependent oxidoreductase [Bdellovibrio sp. HCB117]|uniref:FAD-dependent oxidoreductase n=1 Tax=Bdellovibrio TaxID=958 RepID=UPI0009BEF9E7|nr:FAD-dependent oxidoreductase [Bdellovibrio bacteriovorus]
MNTYHTHETHSYWMDSVEMPPTKALDKDLMVDTCVVGGGLGGLITAYLLMKEGRSVCVLEAHELGSGQTGRTTAHFTTALDDRYFEIERLHGEEKASFAAESHQAALDEIERIIKEEGIECEMQHLDGYLFLAEGDHLTTLEDEFRAATRAGLIVKLVQQPPLGFDCGTCLCFPRQIQLHPLKLLRGLADTILKKGQAIFTNTVVVDVQGGEQASVTTRDGHTVRAQNIVVATNSPINDLFAIHTKQAPYRTYVVAGLIAKGRFPHVLCWDTGDPYHYIRTTPYSVTHDLIIVGGEDHKTGQNPYPEHSLKNLEEWARTRFPIESVRYRWSGQVMEPVDGMGFLGHNPMDKNNVYIITGDSGNGMTHCVVGGILIRDQIMNRPNPWQELYDPSRVNLKAAKEFISENANVAAQYTEYVTPDHVKSLDDIPEGEGAVVNLGLKKVAVYKDEVGHLEFMSAVCPHLAGVVHWNSLEKSWDCPCHGSRFDCHGKVIEGPAFDDLTPVGHKDKPKEQDSISPPPA